VCFVLLFGSTPVSEISTTLPFLAHVVLGFTMRLTPLLVVGAILEAAHAGSNCENGNNCQRGESVRTATSLTAGPKPY